MLDFFRSELNRPSQLKLRKNDTKPGSFSPGHTCTLKNISIGAQMALVPDYNLWYISPTTNNKCKHGDFIFTLYEKTVTERILVKV
jgi:hypothetical protein